MDPMLTFSQVTSSPDPVVNNSTQIISKKLHYKGPNPVPHVTACLSQYWKAFNRTWFRFLSIDTDMCAEHPGACPLEAGATKTLVTHHPPLSKLTPHGWYRSKQIYRNKDTGEKMGCVDMRFEFCRSASSCKYDLEIALSDEEHDAAVDGLIKAQGPSALAE